MQRTPGTATQRSEQFKVVFQAIFDSLSLEALPDRVHGDSDLAHLGTRLFPASPPGHTPTLVASAELA